MLFRSNPDHLFAGTNKDNQQDASRKGLTTKGRKYPPRSVEWCRNIGIGRKGVPIEMEKRAGMNQDKKGVPKSLQQKEKMRIARLAWWDRQRSGI